MRHLERDFFARNTLSVARDLLGKRLVRLLDGERLSGSIVEVEAYIGEDDQASHAHPGRTERNTAMYKRPGTAYVYLIYGMHHCFNIVTEKAGFPAAILIRALQPLEGLTMMRARRRGRPDLQLTNGPGKLCQALGIDRRFDRTDLCAPEARLFVEDDKRAPDTVLASSPRIGVRGDDVAVAALWRFYLCDNVYVSRTV
jgi:DNA-3-methyladenine glycosylase